jgi:Kef-type K+ transport system membrane component KefB
VLGTIVAFLLIRSYGETLAAPTVSHVVPATTSVPAGDVFLRVLIALAAIIVTGQVLAKGFALLGQPPVIGEVVAGILLGPSLLGPQISALVLPPSVAPYLGVIAQLGVVLYMFLVGLELNPALLKHRAHAIFVTSHASIIAPFFLGTLLAILLYPRLSQSDVSFTSFALFMGVAMSITAFPVLARILSDLRISKTRLGVVALSCAAVNDVTAWCLLAFVVGVVKAEVGRGLTVAAGALAFITVMLVLGRPALIWLAKRWDGEQQTRGAAALVCSLPVRLTAEAIGIHAIFGAFCFGTMIPHDSSLPRALTRQLEHIVNPLAAGLFRLYRQRGTDRPAVRFEPVVDLRIDHSDRRGREVRGHVGGGALDRSWLARRRGLGNAHEHSRTHGTDCAQCRAGFGRYLTHALCNDGLDGPRHDDADIAGGTVVKAAGDHG